MLLKAKQWITLDDASKRLSESFNEDVTTKDILQLAIENRLNISYFLSGRVALLIKDEDALYGWSYTKSVINDKALRLKISGLIKVVLSEIVLGVTDIDNDLFDQSGYWWSVIDGENEFRPIWIGREDVHDESFVDIVDNIPLKLRCLVIQTADLLEFERSLLDEQNQELKIFSSGDEALPKWNEILINPPQFHSDLFELVKDAVKTLISQTGSLPDIDDVMDFIGLTKKNEKANLRKSWKRYTKSKDKV